MTLHYDKWGRVEEPTLSLCTASSVYDTSTGEPTQLIGRINPTGLEGDLNFNANSTMSMTVLKENQDPSVYERIKNRMYVFVQDIGYFIITDCEEVRDATTGQQSKAITITSADKELEDVEAPYLEDGLYYLATPSATVVGRKYIFNIAQSVSPRWQFSVKWLDSHYPDYDTTARYLANIEYDNMYTFLMECVQERFDCFFMFDIKRRVISVYAKSLYASFFETDIHLSDVNVIKEFKRSATDEDTFTAMKVSGGEGLDIGSVNPIGGNTIYDFTSRLDEMSPELRAAVQTWAARVVAKTPGYRTSVENYYTNQSAYATALTALTAAQAALSVAQQNLDNVVASDNATPEALEDAKDRVRGAQEDVAAKQHDVDVAFGEVETSGIDLAAYHAELALAANSGEDPIFTDALIEELSGYITTGEFTDENLIKTDEMTIQERFDAASQLLSEATEQLTKYSSVNYKFEIDAEDLLFAKHFEYFANQLQPGVVVWAEAEPDVFEQFHVSTIHFNADDQTSTLTFSSKFNKYDIQSLFDEVLGSVQKSASQVSRVVDIIADQEKQVNTNTDAIKNMMTLTADHVLASGHQNITISDTGITGRKNQIDASTGKPKQDENGFYLFEPEQVKLINNGLYITDDDWDSVKAAIGKIVVGTTPGTEEPIYAYGVIADVIIGKLLAGNRLAIEAQNGNGDVLTTIDENGLTVTNGGITIKNNDGVNVLFADSDGNLTLNGKINAASGSIGNWAINSHGLYGHVEGVSGTTVGMRVPAATNTKCFFAGGTDATGTSAPFYVLADGSIYGSQGTIGGWTLGANALYGSQTIDGTTYYTGMQTPSASNTKCFFAGGTAEDGTDAFFYVQPDGSMYAEKGTVGRWTINKNSIAYDFYGVPCALFSPVGDTGISLAIGATYHQGWHTAPFYVETDGTLHASGAVISGTVYASRGNFANGCTFGGSGVNPMKVGEVEIMYDYNTSTQSGTKTTVHGFISSARNGYGSVIGVNDSGYVFVGYFNASTELFTGFGMLNGLTYRYNGGVSVGF